VTTTSERPSGSRIQIAARQSGDRALARLLGLPAPTTEYAVNQGLRVPMRDGVDLVADHYAPADGADVAGTLLKTIQLSSQTASLGTGGTISYSFSL